MALEIKGLQRVFKFKKDSMELVLDDPNSELSVNEVMDFYSMTGQRNNLRDFIFKHII